MEFTNPEVADEIAGSAARNESLAPWYGVRATWVAERRRGEVVGVLHAAPPLPWIASIEGLSREHRSRLANRVVELEALAVAPSARGERLGHRLIDRACDHYRGLGYRLVLGTFTTSTSEHLVAYYQQAGFTVREPGQSISVLDPMGMALHRPSDAHVVQMWKPLHPDVGTIVTTMPDSSQVEIVTGALDPPGRAPDKVVHHDDGSMTLRGGGHSVTLPAQHVEKWTQVAATEVTTAEVAAIAAEAELYGVEPMIAAKLTKASGYSLADLMGSPRRG